MPAELASFRVIRHPELATVQQDDLLAALRQIPRPPRALQQLVSPDFINKASSTEMAELVMSEPLIAAKVLACVNSPLYGLKTPVINIGQAITFLGMNTVRGICIQYMLEESFKAPTPELKKVFDTLWKASALASELCARLAQKMRVTNAGSLVSKVVLSFLGHLATATLLQKEQAVALSSLSLLDQTRTEQELLGLGATEIGAMLMREWALPDGIIEDVQDLDAILVTPIGTTYTRRAGRLALGYLCARLGERLARGQLPDLESFDPLTDDSVDFFHLQGYLNAPAFSTLTECLHAPDVVGPLRQLNA